jgi:hypothetical protein
VLDQEDREAALLTSLETKSMKVTVSCGFISPWGSSRSSGR